MYIFYSVGKRKIIITTHFKFLIEKRTPLKILKTAKEANIIIRNPASLTLNNCFEVVLINCYQFLVLGMFVANITIYGNIL